MTPNRAEPFCALLERRLTRRRMLAAGSELALLTMAANAAWPGVNAGPLGFRTLRPNKLDAVTVPDGYSVKTVLRWGDPLFSGVAPLDPVSVAAGSLLEPAAAARQQKQFGFNCDGLGIFEIDGDRLVLCVNHEYPTAALLFPGWDEARSARRLGEFVRAHPAAVAVMQAAVGVSVVEVDRRSWKPRVDSRFNRRVTAQTEIELTGPAREHALLNPERHATLTVRGTLNNCAAGTTPWRTFLSAEENIDDFFGNGSADVPEDIARARRRLGVRPRESAYRWEFADERFDAGAHPTESLKFGWIVEVDPFDPASRPKKRTALGRFKHEGATPVVAPDGRVAVYLGDDQEFEYFYKFVTAGRFDPQRPSENRDLLDSGTLYVARFADDGSGQWLPLVFGAAGLTPENSFGSQADVLLRCREAADHLRATPLDRPEDVAVNPLTGNVYVALTQGLDRGRGPLNFGGRQVDSAVDGVNPRAPNPSGQIIELAESGADPTATTFHWDVFVLAGAPGRGELLATSSLAPAAPLPADATYYAGSRDAQALSAFANPDNLGFDAAGNLWIVTDGPQPDGNNNGCFVSATEGAERGRVRQFMCGPIGAEICGCEITADGRTLLLTIQHPGEGGSATAPNSHWPDGGEAAPRPTLVAIERDDGRGPVGS
jgi:uncharacterized protein